MSTFYEICFVYITEFLCAYICKFIVNCYTCNSKNEETMFELIVLGKHAVNFFHILFLLSFLL